MWKRFNLAWKARRGSPTKIAHFPFNISVKVCLALVLILVQVDLSLGLCRELALE